MTLAKKGNVVENFHGTNVHDPYRWLENPESAETIAWSDEVAKKSNAYFNAVSSETNDKQRLKALWNYPKFFVPKVVKSNLFYQKNDGLQNQAILYREANGSGEMVIDPNQLSDDGTIAMTSYEISHEGKYIGYATSTHGSDWQEIRVRDVDSKEDLTDRIEYVKFSSITWAPDDSGFFYSHFPAPEMVAKEDEGKYHAVYFHKLGAQQQDVELIFEDKEDKDLMYIPLLSDDKRYLYIYVNRGTNAENRVYIKDLHADSDFTRLLDKEDAGYGYVTNVDNIFYFQTNLDAPNERLIAIDITRPDGMGKPTSKVIDEWADFFAFLDNELAD